MVTAMVFVLDGCGICAKIDSNFGLLMTDGFSLSEQFREATDDTKYSA